VSDKKNERVGGGKNLNVPALRVPEEAVREIDLPLAREKAVLENLLRLRVKRVPRVRIVVVARVLPFSFGDVGIREKKRRRDTNRRGRVYTRGGKRSTHTQKRVRKRREKKPGFGEQRREGKKNTFSPTKDTPQVFARKKRVFAGLRRACE
jgi:hypothetical protein